jgi:hypothetical protein
MNLPLAHALVSRGDLPLPVWLFAWGAGVVLVVSFFALASAWRKPKLEDPELTPASRFTSFFASSLVVQIPCGIFGVFLLALVIHAGLAGTEAADRNFSLTFVFVTVWLGFPVLSAFFGNVFSAFSPWRAIARFAGRAATLITKGDVRHLHYPERLGRWPAALGLVAFVWLEIIYGATGAAVVLSPEIVAKATIIYSIYTLAMMALFGTEKWSSRGEFFSVYFGMFASLSPFQNREGKVRRRKWLSGATDWATVPGSLALVVSAIGVTTFDGAQEGALKAPIEWAQERFSDLGFAATISVRAGDTIFLLVCIGIVAGVYLLGVKGMTRLPNSPSFVVLRDRFAHTLIPIALAYLVAHYFSLFVFQEQAQFTFLLSDPLGNGSNLFGTASSGIDYTLIGPELVWYVQVGALIAGHVTALVLAHDRALLIWSDYRIATRSQYWMLAVMLCFTSLGLFLLSFANQ